MTGDDDLAETMRARLQVDLRSAMKRRDALEVSTLRCLIGALDNAGAVDDPLSTDGPRDWSKTSEHVFTGSHDGPTEVARRSLSSAEVIGVLAREMAARDTAATTLESHGRSTEAERAEIDVIARYLD